MKKTICILLVTLIICGCTKPPKTTEEEIQYTLEPLSGLSDFSVYREDTIRIVELKKGRTDFTFTASAEFMVMIDDKNDLRVSLNSENNNYEVEINYQERSKGKLSERLNLHLVEMLVDKISKDKISVEELREFVDSDEWSYRSPDSDPENGDLIDKRKGSIGNSPYILSFNVDEDYDGCFKVIGNLDYEKELHTIINLVEETVNDKIPKRERFSYNYSENWNIELENDNTLVFDLSTVELTKTSFDSTDIAYRIECKRKIDEKEVTRSGLDVDLFVMVVNLFHLVQTDNDLLAKDFVDEFIIDVFNEISYDAKNVVLIKNTDEIPGIKGELQYRINSELEEALVYDAAEYLLMEKNDQESTFWGEDSLYGQLLALDNESIYRSAPQKGKETSLGNLQKDEIYRVFGYKSCKPFDSGKYKVVGWFLIDVDDELVWVADIKQLVQFTEFESD